MTNRITLTEARARITRHLEARGTAAPADEVRERLTAALAEFDGFIGGLGPAEAEAGPGDGGWSARDVVDHVVESDRACLDEIRCVVAGERPPEPPIPASLRSRAPHRRPWPWLVRESATVHADMVEACAGGGEQSEGEATAAIVLVVSGETDTGEQAAAEWIVEADWRAYAACLRVHAREHLDQIRAGLSVQP